MKGERCLSLLTPPPSAAEQLEVLVQEAVQHVGGARQAVDFAKHRHMVWKVTLTPCSAQGAQTCDSSWTCTAAVTLPLPLTTTCPRLC